MAKTCYVILEETVLLDGTEGWAEFGPNVESTSAAGALRVALDGQGNLGKSYVAVPMRSWKPQSVVVETRHRVKIG